MYSLRESSNFTVEKTNRHYIEPERSKFTWPVMGQTQQEAPDMMRWEGSLLS